MDIIPLDPWNEIEKVHQEANRLLEEWVERFQKLEAGREKIGFSPSVDFVETNEDYRIFLSIPGLVEEDIDLTLDGRLLIVRGERESPYDPARAKSRIVEWRYGFFERRIRLPGEIDPSSLTATYQAGVLTVVVPKSRDCGRDD